MPEAYHRTRYMVELVGPGELDRYIVGATAQVSRLGLLKLAQSVGEAIIAVAKVPADAEIEFHARGRFAGMPEATLGNGWAICFTGETQKHRTRNWLTVQEAAAF